jgi:hypothetical protein
MKTGTNTKPATGNFNKFAYATFLLAGIYFLIKKDFSQAIIFWALAPAFDPFDVQVPFKKRPVYQQLWLWVHVSITLALVVLEIIRILN